MVISGLPVSHHQSCPKLSGISAWDHFLGTSSPSPCPAWWSACVTSPSSMRHPSQGGPCHHTAQAGSQAGSPTPEGCEHSPWEGRDKPCSSTTTPGSSVAGRAGSWGPETQTGKCQEAQLTLARPAGTTRGEGSPCAFTLRAGDARGTSGCISAHVQGKERKHLPWEGSELYQESSTSDREQGTDRKGKGKGPSGQFIIAAKQKGLVRPG